MPPTIPKEVSVYFLAEAPGKHEDEESGRPLTGPSGSLLRECIPSGREKFCAFDNTVRDRPPKNRTPTWVEMECCRPKVIKSIEEAKPDLIVGLGTVPLQWMLKSTDMAGMRGRPFAVKVGNHSCWFMPTYHPSYILRTAYDKKKPLNSKFGHCFRMDIQRAFKLRDSLPKAKVDNEDDVRSNVTIFDGSSGFDDLWNLLNRVQEAPVKAIDIETKGLRPYYGGSADIMSVAISFDDVNFAFAWNHPETKWTPAQKAKIEEKLHAIIADDTVKIAHNVPFEAEWFIQWFSVEVINHASWECTQMQAHFIDERRGKQHRDGADRTAYQALGFLCRQHFGINIKDPFKLNKKDMSKTPINEMLIYNGADTKYTLRLWHHQGDILKKNGVHKAYLEALPRQPTVALMQSLGMCVDQAEREKQQKQLEKEVEDIKAKIASLKVVQAYVADNGEFNPASNDHVLSIFKDYLKRPEVEIAEESGPKFSTDKKVLDQIDHPLAKLILELRNKAKMKSTYVDILEPDTEASVLFPDKRIHCNFNTTFAETGRTSSDYPNMQNYPSRTDSHHRRQVEADPGHVLLAFDYGQLEACTGAMCSKDKTLIKALWEDYDIHMDFSLKVIKKWKDAPVIASDPKSLKKFRSLIKNKLVFPAFFGAAATSIAGYLNMPEETAEALMDEFWDMFSGMAKWQKETMKKYYDIGHVESPTGRRHYYPLTKSQVVNFPIQSLACDIVCSAMNELSYKAVTEDKMYLHPRLNIHDDLTFSVPDNVRDTEEAIDTIYRTMLTPPYSCINVPLSVSCSIGRNWGPYDKVNNPNGLQEIGKFWSHKDL